LPLLTPKPLDRIRYAINETPMKRKVLVIGAGIKGSAIAALLSLDDSFEVILIDKGKVGSGTTSTNHGRLHLGTSGWRTETDDLISRRMQGSMLMRQLPEITTCSSEGYYCIEHDKDLTEFVAKCSVNRIPHRILQKNELDNSWINLDQFAGVIQVPEFSFNPARVAGRLANSFVQQGGTLQLGQSAKRLYREGERIFLELENESSIEADIVINASTRWCNTVKITDCDPLFAIEWFRWRLLCLRSEDLPLIRQVTVVVDPQKKSPSAIPHEHWITIDCKTDLEQLDTPEGDQNSSWRPIDLTNRIDFELYSTGCSYFQPLQQLAVTELPTKLFSMAGIHARLIGAPPGSVNRVYSTEDCPNYFLTFGGQASTAILDAIETLEHLASLGVFSSIDREELIQQLACSLTTDPLPNSNCMAWEQPNT
jgi:FAD dependent oxidoreductase